MLAGCRHLCLGYRLLRLLLHLVGHPLQALCHPLYVGVLHTRAHMSSKVGPRWYTALVVSGMPTRLPLDCWNACASHWARASPMPSTLPMSFSSCACLSRLMMQVGTRPGCQVPGLCQADSRAPYGDRSTFEVLKNLHLLQHLLPSRCCYARRLHLLPFGREGATPSPFAWCFGQDVNSRGVTRFCVSLAPISTTSWPTLRHLSTADKCNGSRKRACQEGRPPMHCR